MEERLQKIMARAGLGSRRACEEIIATGRVRVNGRVIGLGDKADASRDTIQVDGRILPKHEPESVYIVLNKPQGVLSDVNAQDSRPTVQDLVPIDKRFFAVGRLDIDSEGLVLLTNDGELANLLTHPRYEHDKEYRVLLDRQPDLAQMEAWRHGVVLDDGYRTAPVKLILDGASGKRCWVRVIMHEGRKRQIREICAKLGLEVHRLVRVRIGTISLGNLKPRQWRNLTKIEVRMLRELVGEKPAPRKPRK